MEAEEKTDNRIESGGREQGQTEYGQYPGCYCDTCDIGRERGCPHARGRHYDLWGEGLGHPDYCPFNDRDEALPF